MKEDLAIVCVICSFFICFTYVGYLFYTDYQDHLKQVDLIEKMDCKSLLQNMKRGDFHEKIQPNDTMTFIVNQYVLRCLT